MTRGLSLCALLAAFAACKAGGAGSPTLVAIEAPERPLFVGEWRELAVAIRANAGVAFGDLRFAVVEGSAGGSVSVSQPERPAGEAPTVMLLGGAVPGRYTLRATRDNLELASAPFEITDRRERGLDGPSLWFTGTSGPRYGAMGAAWGGGPAEVQNVRVFPQSGTRRVALLLVDNASQRYPDDPAKIAELKARWLAHLAEGVNDARRGQVSVARYFREVSGGKLDVAAEAFGPVHMPGTFDDYFEDDETPAFRGDFAQQCLTAGDPLIDYARFDTVLCVSPAVNMPDPATRRAAWPSASLGEWGPYKTAEGDLAMGIISMPAEWTELDGRQLYATLAHELAHNLGLRDQYRPDAGIVSIDGWDLMHADAELPHLSLGHRLMLGWVDPAHVLSFNVARLPPAGRLGGRYTLDPVEKTVPFENLPVERHLIGIEFRKADGVNHYFEYRRGLPALVGDRGDPISQAGGGGVLVSEVGPRTARRPEITSVIAGDKALVVDPDDASGGRARLVEMEDEETGYRAILESANEGSAELLLEYGSFRPDPAIRPWPAGPGRRWQSPDIEVTNARAEVDPEWRNVPWLGHLNTVRSTIHNRGNRDALVSVVLTPKNYNVGGVPDEAMTSTEFNLSVPYGTEAVSSIDWIPEEGGHHCLDVYVKPNDARQDVSVANNRAQSNYTRFFSDSASPARRVVTDVEVGNPWDRPTVAYITAHQTNAAFRTYLEHAWVQLGPREVRKVKVMFEYAGNDPTGMTPVSARAINDVSLSGWGLDPDPAVWRRPDGQPEATPELLGGADVQVVSGRRTKFASFSLDAKNGSLSTASFAGRVVEWGGDVVSGGKVLVEVQWEDGRRPTYASSALRPDGTFVVSADAGPWKSARAFYLSASPWADCESEAAARP